MKSQRLAWPAVALMTAALVGATDQGCSTETKDTADTSSDSTAANKKRANRAKIGDSITLKGSDNKMKVKLVRVIDPLPTSEFDQPDAGKRYVGVEIVMSNVGDSTYDDSPSNGATLITTRDEQADGTILGEGECSSEFASSATISAGSRQRGCMPFEVKAQAKLKTFQLSLDSGFGPQTGEWSLR